MIFRCSKCLKRISRIKYVANEGLCDNCRKDKLCNGAPNTEPVNPGNVPASTAGITIKTVMSAVLSTER